VPRFGEPGGGLIYLGLKDVNAGGSIYEGSLTLKRLHGGPGGCFFTGDSGRYIEKALEKSISLYWGPALGNREEGSSTWDFGM
jgi:hypothetical protein